jgi:hypothetical protein
MGDLICVYLWGRQMTRLEKRYAYATVARVALSVSADSFQHPMLSNF